MTRKKWCLIGAAILGLSGIGASINPIAHTYVAPMVKEQVNNAIKGSVNYDSLRINWNGDVVLTDVTIKDRDNHLVGTAREVAVGVKLSALPSIITSNTSGATAISSVIVEAPDFHIWQLADGSWSVEKLVKSSDPNKSGGFDGSITIHDGHVAVRTKDGIKRNVENLDGTMALNMSGMSKGAFTADVDGSAITMNGKIDMNNVSNFDLFVQANEIDTAGIMRFVPLRKELSVTSGKLQDIHLNLKSEDGKYIMSGNVGFKGLTGTYKRGNTIYNITDGTGRIMLNNDQIVISRSSWRVNDQVAKINGLVTLGKDEEYLNLNVVADKVALEAITDVGVTGIVGGRAHIGGTTVAPRVDATIASDGISYKGYYIDRLQGNIVYDNGLVRTDDAHLSIGEGSAKIKGQYVADTGDFDAIINTQDLPLGTFTKDMTTPITGNIDGEIRILGKNNQVTDAVGAVEGRQIGIHGVVVDTVKANFTHADNRTNITVVGTMGDGTLSGYGYIQNGNVDATISGNALPLTALSPIIGQDVDGTLNTSFAIKGIVDNPNVTGTVWGQEVHYKGARFNNIHGDIKLDNHILTIINGHIGDGDGGYDVNGWYNLDTDALDLNARARAARIENVIRTVTDVPITGWFETDNHITGTAANPIIEGRAHLWDGSAYEKLVTNAFAKYNYQNDTLELYRFDIEGYGATITGGGTVSKEVINVDFEGKNIDMGRLLINTGYKVDGLVSGRGQITGSMDNPQFNGYISSDALSVNGELLNDIHGRVYADKSVVNVQDFTFAEADGGRYAVKGGIKFDDSRQLFGVLDVTNGSVKNLLNLLDRSNEHIDGKLNGSVEIGGTRDNPSVNVTGKINDVSIDEKIVGDATINASFANRKFKVTTLKLPVGDGLIAIGGTMDLDGQADLQVALKDVDIVPFLPLIGKDIQATGWVTGVVNITGETKNPKVELSSAIESGSFNGVGIDEGFVLATMQDQVIQIQRIQGAKSGYKLSVYGKIPLAAIFTSGYIPANDSKSMDVTIDFNEADMAVIPLLTTSVKEATGPLKGTVHITGTIDQPEAYGTVSVRNGTMKLSSVENQITGIDGDLIFSGQQGDFQSRINMGKGSAGLAAKVNWSGHTLTNYKAAVQLEDLEVRSEYVRGPLNGELYIADRDGLPTLIGTLNLEKIQFIIPLSLQSSESTKDMGVDVTVHAGKGVRLYDRTLYNMFISGDVHFGGSLQNPTASGQFDVRNGTFKYLSHVFNITKGNAHFVGGSYLPNLQLEAETNVSNYTIMLGVKGTVDHMDLSLSSNPTLSRKQIISMLTFGRGADSNSSTLTNEDVNAVATAGLQMFAFGYVQDALQNTLGLDRINITTGSIDPDEPTNRDTASNYNIEIGKYVLPRVMLTYSQGINNKQNKYGIEYSVKRNLKFTGWHTSKGNNYIGGRWTRSF
ncbi:MAG: translocation/assembly module TamB domain-containing protein [Veillonella sp.]|uniref:translocation/assembly module TamB domain-containing protein n=1 Tax=Veillonella sp. TaxID=1926307 RepID=UPI002910BB84|nr:translocation/assembly module TamB domain-containing protein [Veillonella sp.]MDU7928424.1 translocation/assembly module TamB domain-containing protein [Veillonella sp.]